MPFRPAINYQRFLCMALIGPPKSGKSFTALTIASTFAQAEGGTFAVIDTEHASAAKYRELFPPFDVCELERFSPDDYVREIQEAERAGYKVLIIDSLSHAWNGPGGLLEYKDQIAKSNRPGMNSYTAWSEASPKHTKLMYAITHARMHIIVTMRTKVEYVLEQDAQGKAKPVKVGLAPIQREDAEYEFDILGMIDKSHTLHIDDSRCPALDNKIIEKPGPAVAAILREWLAGEPIPEQELEMRQLLAEFRDLYPAFCARTAQWEQMTLHNGLDIPEEEALPATYTDDDVARFKLYIASKRKEKQPTKQSA